MPFRPDSCILWAPGCFVPTESFRRGKVARGHRRCAGVRGLPRRQAGGGGLRLLIDLNRPPALAIGGSSGLRDRTTKRGRGERHLHGLWPYARFRSLLEYKAALKGVRVVAADPRYSSQECPRCGHTARENREGQALFRCTVCGFQHNADWVAAANIARRAGSTGMGRCKPARILGVSSPHRPSSESPRL